MKTYIGTKIIQAEPALRIDGKVHSPDEILPEDTDVEVGYRVRYPDGYESWSPRDVFEAAYMPVLNNPQLKTNAPSVSQQMVDDFILETWTTTLGDKTTVVRAMLRNGFEIVESSACVSAENYDETMGRAICMEKIKDKVWFLLGFLLQTAVHGVKKTETEADRPAYGMTFGVAIEAAKKGAKITRRGWNGKGMWVVYRTGYPDGIPCNKNTAEAVGIPEGSLFKVRPYLQMKCVDGSFQMWLASQSDILADDWEIVEG